MSFLKKFLNRQEYSIQFEETKQNTVVVFARGVTASLDYYVLPFICNSNAHAHLVDLRDTPPSSIPFFRDKPIAVFVRYLPQDWINIAYQLQSKGYEIIYFMDDDLLDIQTMSELSGAYRRRLLKDGLKQKKYLEQYCNQMWVSTPYLAQKYASWHPTIISSHPVIRKPECSEFWTVFHGNLDCHQAQIAWLLPIFQILQQEIPNIRLEIFGDGAVFKRFRGLPKISIVHPMSWTNYLDFSSVIHRDIALVPLLPTRFNAGRGPSKFFDNARMGAVGLYTDVAPYRGFIRHEVDGLLLPNDPNEWVKAVKFLKQSPHIRERMVLAARERIYSEYQGNRYV